MFQSFLIKYAEIGLKGKNRYVFEDALMKHIRRSLKELEGTFAVTKESGRIYVEAKSEFDYDEVVEALQRVFGIAAICPVMRVEDLGCLQGAELYLQGKLPPCQQAVSGTLR